MKTLTEFFLPVKRWKEDDILHAENDFCHMAYVVDDEKAKSLKTRMGWHPYRDTEMWVEYITTEQGKLWD
jgi:hypothetical protein